jgi:hypothetical protein
MIPLVAALLAAAVVAVLHMLFLVYMTVGGFLALYRFHWIWPSIGVTVYSVYVTLTDFTCPVTRLEKWLLEAGGRTPYEGSFTAHYLRGELYPPEFETLIWLGAMALSVSAYVLVFVLVFARRWRSDRAEDVAVVG